jgi:hypothetical protein
MDYSLQNPTQLVDDLKRVLAEAHALGVTDPGRFTDYLNALEAFSKLSFPRAQPWGDDAALTWEANAQATQLVTSNRIWSIVNQDALRSALLRIMRGEVLPPQEEEDDQPRNTLLELTTAALLHYKNFSVDLTVRDEDVIATADGLPGFAIECKRPATAKGLLRNLARAKSQLQTRYKKGRQHGIAVFGVDRVLNLVGEGLVARDRAHIEAGIHGKLRQLRDDLLATMNDPEQPQYQLFPETPLFGLVLVGSVFNAKDGVPVSIQQLSLSCSGPEGDPVSRRILSVVQPLLNR